MLKALALGAAAVLLGRPYVYGLAVGGEAGVRRVVQNLLADTALTLALCGRRAVAEVDRALVAPAEAPPAAPAAPTAPTASPRGRSFPAPRPQPAGATRARRVRLARPGPGGPAGMTEPHDGPARRR